MPAGDLVITNGDVRLHVSGLSRLMRDMEAAGAQSADMRALMHKIGMIVVREAKTRVKSSSIRKTIRAGRGKTKAVIRAGSNAVPYAGVIHYGTPPNYIRRNDRPFPLKPDPYIHNALEATQEDVYRALIDGLDEILKKNNLA